MTRMQVRISLRDKHTMRLSKAIKRMQKKEIKKNKSLGRAVRKLFSSLSEV